jgi:hypothetical protein
MAAISAERRCGCIGGHRHSDNTPTSVTIMENQTQSAPPIASHDLLAVARVIPHPWKEGRIRNVYEFPVTRKIIIEADPDVPESQIIAMAKRCQDKEIGLEITGGGYRMSLSPANACEHTTPRNEA